MCYWFDSNCCQPFLNQIIPCLGRLWFFMDVIRFKPSIEFFESIHFGLSNIWSWLGWFVSMFFELYQTSSGLHDSIQFLAHAYLKLFKHHLENCLIRFIVLKICIYLYSFQISSFYTIWIDSCFLWFDWNLLFSG